MERDIGPVAEVEGRLQGTHESDLQQILFQGEGRILTCGRDRYGQKSEKRKMTGDRIPREVKGTILRILKPHGVRRVAIFGSYARGEAGPGSDIDILVRFAQPKSLFDLVGIEEELEQALHLKVDLLTEKAVSPYLIDSVRHDEVVILG